MHEYRSSQHCVVSYYTSFVVFLVKYVVKDSCGTIYIAFRYPGQIVKPGTVPEIPGHLELMRKASKRVVFGSQCQPLADVVC